MSILSILGDMGLGESKSKGLLSELPQGTLVIDSSTIAAADARIVAEAASQAGIDFLDAPVSGGTGGAIAGVHFHRGWQC